MDSPERVGYQTSPHAPNTPENNVCKLVEYRSAKVSEPTFHALRLTYWFLLTTSHRQHNRTYSGFSRWWTNVSCYKSSSLVHKYYKFYILIGSNVFVFSLIEFMMRKIWRGFFFNFFVILLKCLGLSTFIYLKACGDIFQISFGCSLLDGISVGKNCFIYKPDCMGRDGEVSCFIFVRRFSWFKNNQSDILLNLFPRFIS